MPSKQETGTSSLPQEPPQKPPQVAFLKASPRSRRFHRLSKKPPIKQQIKKRRIKNEERIVNFQRPIGQR